MCCVCVRECAENHDCWLHPIFSCRFEHVLNFRPTKIEWYQLLTRPNCVTLINTSAKRKPTIKFVHLVNNYENSVYIVHFATLFYPLFHLPFLILFLSLTSHSLSLSFSLSLKPPILSIITYMKRYKPPQGRTKFQTCARLP